MCGAGQGDLRVLTPANVMRVALDAYSSLPAEGIAEVALAALASGGYVVVPKAYLMELITASAGLASAAVTA